MCVFARRLTCTCGLVAPRVDRHLGQVRRRIEHHQPAPIAQPLVLDELAYLGMGGDPPEAEEVGMADHNREREEEEDALRQSKE